MSELETARDSPPVAIKKPTTPFIFTLPIELLTRIFGNVRGEKQVYEKDLSFSNTPEGSADSMKQVRLTCRRFYETSSHLLLDYIPVCLTRQSLAHLDEVSRHPFLSKGVRVIKLDLVPFYDAVLADDIRAFATYRTANLWESIDNWEMKKNYESFAHLNISAEVTKAKSLAELWEEVAVHGINTIDTDYVFLARAHMAYTQRYRHHKDLSDSLPWNIASAMMRMPKASWLTADDFSKGQQKHTGILLSWEGPQYCRSWRID